MWAQFLLINIHFSLNITAALTFMMVAWLYFDSWFEHREIKNAFKIGGFLLLALSFLIQAVVIDSTVLGSSANYSYYAEIASIILRTLGYAGVVVGLLLDPLPKIPKTKGITVENLQATAVFAPFAKIMSVPFTLFISLASFILPILSGFVGLLHMRRAVLGLERHLVPLAWGMFVFSLYELLSFSLRIEGVKNVFWYNLLRPYGFAWITSNVLLLLGTLVIGFWVFKYLLKRIQSQIFIIYSCSVLVIFLTITVSFTWLLLRNIESEALNQLETDMKVLNYAVESKKSESVSDAIAFAQTPQLASLLSLDKTSELEELSESYLISKNLNSVIILDNQGIIVARGEDKEHKGLSMSSDALFLRGVKNESVGSTIARQGIFAPEINLSAVSPITNDGKVLGVVLISRKLDNAFVDGIKKATGLEVSLYGGNKLSATTLTALDKNARANGVIEDNKTINRQVLGEGKFYQVSNEILSRQYLASYMPVRDINTKILGMLFVGRPEVLILDSALRSIQATFVIASLLLLFSILPSYFISRYIARQLN